MPKRKFTQHFRDYVFEGDAISIDLGGGLEATAMVYRDDDNSAPDKRQDGFWPSLDPKDDGYIGNKSKRSLAREMERAATFYKQWEDGELVYCGIAVTIHKAGVQLTHQYDHAVWGVDCNFKYGRRRTNSYLRDVANELLPEAIADATSKLAKLAA